jgi:hypothetical protein
MNGILGEREKGRCVLEIKDKRQKQVVNWEILTPSLRSREAGCEFLKE